MWEGIEFARSGLEADDLHGDIEISLMNIMSMLFDRLSRVYGESRFELKALLLREKVLEVVPSNHPSRALYEHNLSVHLRHRFGIDPEKHHEDIDREVFLSRQAVLRTPKSHPWRPRFSNALFKTLEMRRRYHPDQSLAESIDAGIDAFENGTKPFDRITAARQVAEA